MKIFLSFLQGRPDHPIPAYSFWEYYIKNGIKESGHEWIECPDIDWAEGLVPKTKDLQRAWKTRTWEKTVSFLKKERVDFFLSYLYPQQIDISAIEEIKKLGIPCVNFFCDHVREFKKIPAEFSCFTLSWVPEKKALKMYEYAGYNSCHLPMPMWVDYPYRDRPINRTQNITFIGSKDIQRQLLFEQLLEEAPQLPVLICGSGWEDKSNVQTSFPRLSPKAKIYNQLSFLKAHGIEAYIRRLKQRNLAPPYSDRLKMHIGGKPNFNEYINLTRESLVTIGVNRFPSFNYALNTPQTYSRLRDLEAPMLGACYLTEWTDGIDELYELGKEIITYDDTFELIDKIIFLQKNESVRENLRSLGQKRALNHNIGNSLNFIFKRLSGKQ